MTTGVRCTARPGCDGIAPAGTGWCADCARQRQAGRQPGLALLIRQLADRALRSQADREAGA